MGTTHILAVSLYQEWKQRRYAFMRFIRTLLWKQRGIEKIAPIEVQTEDRLYTIFTKFVEDISILLSSVENIKSITHWMKMNCSMHILLKTNNFIS